MTDHRDWVGTWLELAEERGEYGKISFVLQDAAGEDSPRFFDHRSCDGIAAMGTIAGVATLPLAPEAWRERPQPRPLPSPFMRKPAASWRTLDPTRLGEPSGRAHRFLSVADTERLRASAKARGVTVNSLLAWALARAIEDELDRTKGAVLFELPVNLRGASLPEDVAVTGNVFSTVTADLGLPTPAEVHAGIRNALTRGEHWSSWNSLNVGREQGLDFVRGAAKSAAASVGFRVGVLSNMGVWEGAGPTGVAFGPPPAQRTPLAAGAVTWNGRLGVMLLAHANLAEAAPRLPSWLDRWVDASLAAPSA